MSGTSVCKRVTFLGLAGFGVLCLTSIFIIQWYANPIKHRILSILAPECSQESANNTENVDISNEIQQLIDTQRKMLLDDIIAGYQYPDGKYNISAAAEYENSAIEKNGKPIRSIILSTWRSGSTFFGDIFAARPGNFYHFETLSNLGFAKIRGPPLAAHALEKIKAALNCEYENLDELLEYGRINTYMFNASTYLWDRCYNHTNMCFDHRYVSALCKLFPFHLMKLVRPRLRVAEELLADEKLAVRLVLLVRDPRGTVRSMKNVWFYDQCPDCSDPALLCADLVSDYRSAVEVQKKYPTRFRVIRYEDLAADPYEHVKELSKFYGRDFHPHVKDFLDTHTTTDFGGPFDTARNSKTTPYRWKTELEFDEVADIQRSCATAMEYWGYVPAMNATHQKEFNPVTDYVLNL